tara:strand:+ start:5334 stop:5738 length:405 start_codon:yes stop_codon:yes gene_type:complete
LFLFSLNNLFAQKTQHVKEILDTNSFFFEHDIKYIGKSTTISPNYIYVMQSLQEQLKSNPLLSIHVRGHVCCGPSKPISEKRARKAAKYLEKIGVKKERISYCGYSNTRPLVLPEKTEDDAQKNRRVDFILTKQ